MTVNPHMRDGQTPRICSVPECSRPFRARGFCDTHLKRVYAHGSPFGKAPRKISARIEYMLEHMWEDCPKWPFSRIKGGYGNIYYEGSSKVVHRVVCEIAHGPAPSPAHQAAHNCGKGSFGCFGANCVEWKTRVGNAADKFDHGTARAGTCIPSAVLTEDSVQEIRRIGRSISQTQLAARYGVSRTTINSVLTGKTWRSVQ